MNKSVYGYPGGKTHGRKPMMKIIEKHYDINDFDTVISPFFGGGSFEFYLQNKGIGNIIANDLYTPIHSFWTVVKDLDKRKELINTLRSLIGTIDKPKYEKYKEMLGSKSEMDRAVAFIIVNRHSFNSGGNFSSYNAKNFNENQLTRINNLDLDKFEIYNTDFKVFIKNFNSGFMYLDPPYWLSANKNRYYGKAGELHKNFDHHGLASQLKKIKTPWVLSYNDTEDVRKMYKGYVIETVRWSYSSTKHKKSSEILIFNIRSN
jgi:DNA adenine methylase